MIRVPVQGKKFPKNITNRLHGTHLSIVCPFKYLVYMKRQREERPKKFYYTGHEVKSLEEYNIPLRNNECDLYRTRERIQLGTMP